MIIWFSVNMDLCEQPLKFHFPARNRIIAGICRGVIVAEAKMRSGVSLPVSEQWKKDAMFCYSW